MRIVATILGHLPNSMGVVPTVMKFVLTIIMGIVLTIMKACKNYNGGLVPNVLQFVSTINIDRCVHIILIELCSAVS